MYERKIWNLKPGSNIGLVDHVIFSREFKNLKAIILWSAMGKQTAQAKEVNRGWLVYARPLHTGSTVSPETMQMFAIGKWRFSYFVEFYD